MVKKLFTMLLVGVFGAAVGQLWGLDALPGEPNAPTRLLEQNGVALEPEQTPPARLSESGVQRSCVSPAPNATAADVGQACMLLAALTANEETLQSALRAAAAATYVEDADLGDSLLLLSAARGDLSALSQWGSVEDPVPAHAFARREALLLADGAGAQPAAKRLAVTRSAFDGQALVRPQVLVSLLEGRGLELPDADADRRYLLGVARSWEGSCPLQASVWNTVAFRRAQEQYAAPLKTGAHSRVVTTVGDSASQLASAVGQFARQLSKGESYEGAGAQLLRDVRGAVRGLNANASVTDEAGARDGVRMATLLGGCGTADGLRLARGLMGVFSARAQSTPTPLLHAPLPAKQVD
jgi:hypothetical protein